jgi:hypothetical protein
MHSVVNAVKLFIVFVGSYLLVVNHLHLFGLAYAFSYTGALLLLPIQGNAVRIMVFAFLLGLFIDVFSNTPGMHAGACVLLSFLRTGLLEVLKPGGNYEEYMEISIPSMGLKWYLNFMIPALFIHHFYYFIIEFASFSRIGMALLKAALSTFFSLFTIIIIQYAIGGRRRSSLI